tara:strand:+ start:57 stop:344 length:288 start_codon:yes stop_codon:yes gene_type:complete
MSDDNNKTNRQRLRAELGTDINWLQTIGDVADNDPDFEGSWVIPALILDWRGYDTRDLWQRLDLEREKTNEEKTELVIAKINSIVENLQERRTRI